MQGMDGAVRDMALLFGSRKAPHNGELQSLEKLMSAMCEDSCDDQMKLTGVRRHVRRAASLISSVESGSTWSWSYEMGVCVWNPAAGLKIVRAIIYLDPDKPCASERDRNKEQLEEYVRCQL